MSLNGGDIKTSTVWEMAYKSGLRRIFGAENFVEVVSSGCRQLLLSIPFE